MLADVSPGGDSGAEIAVQTDGKIVVAGTHDVEDFAIVRLLADGGSIGLRVAGLRRRLRPDERRRAHDPGRWQIVVAGGLQVLPSCRRHGRPTAAERRARRRQLRHRWTVELRAECLSYGRNAQPDGRILVSAGSATNVFFPTTFAAVPPRQRGAVDLTWGTRGDSPWSRHRSSIRPSISTSPTHWRCRRATGRSSSSAAWRTAFRAGAWSATRTMSRRRPITATAFSTPAKVRRRQRRERRLLLLPLHVRGRRDGVPVRLFSAQAPSATVPATAMRASCCRRPAGTAAPARSTRVRPASA